MHRNMSDADGFKLEKLKLKLMCKTDDYCLYL